MNLADRLRRINQYALGMRDSFLPAVFAEIFGGDPLLNRKHWTVLPLAEVCLKITDGTHFSPPQSLEGYPYVTAKNIKPGKIDVENMTYVSEKDHREIYSRCDPKLEDVLYIKDGATTGLAVVNRLPYEFSMLSSVALIRPDQKKIISEYLEGYLNYPSVHGWVVNQMKGGAIKRLTIERLLEFKLPVPQLVLQQRYSNIVKKFRKLQAMQIEELRQAEHLFQSLLHKAFSEN